VENKAALVVNIN